MNDYNRREFIRTSLPGFLDLRQVIDIFAPPYDPQRSAKSTFFDVDPEPFEGKQGLYEATLA
jgi:hypothetical protein